MALVTRRFMGEHYSKILSHPSFPVQSLLLAIITVACITRLVALDISPPGFFYDEATGAAHSVCYQQTGRDLFNERGLFSRVDFSGYQSAPFLIGGALWSSVFGTDFVGFRSFVAFAGVMTVLGVYVLARGLTGSHERALWPTVLAACLPWAFQFSRVSWDAPLGVALLVWGLALLYRKPLESRSTSKDWVLWTSAGILLTLASYTYSPLRICVGLMILLAPAIHWRPRLVVLTIFALGNLPMLGYYADPDFAHRAQMLAITSDDPRNPFRDASLWGLLQGYVSQMLMHFSWDFLLVTGDQNLRHGIQTHGVLDWFTFAGLLLGVAFAIKALLQFRDQGRAHLPLIAVAVLGIVAGISPAALAWDSLPHALRAIGAWPFIALLAGFGLHSTLTQRAAQLLVACLIAVLFGLYLRSYFIHYPAIAQWWYDAEIVQQIKLERSFPDHYLEVARAYYLMTEFGQSCVETRATLGIEPGIQ